MHGRRRPLLAATATVLLGTSAALSAPAGGSPGGAATVASFADDVAPEGIAITPDGSIYVSTTGRGEVWQVLPDGSTVVEAVLDPALPASSFGVLGVDTDDTGRLYAAMTAGNAASAGVWTWMPGERPQRLAGSEVLPFANSIVVGRDGAIYVTDSMLGEIWRADGPHAPLQRWLAHPWLQGTGEILGDPSLAIGANGIVEQDGILYIAVTEQGSIISVPIEADGSPGAARVWTADPRLFAIDGLTIGPDGVIYAVVNMTNSVYRVGWDTSLTLLAGAADGIDFPSDLDFGVGDTERSLYVVNFAIGELFGLSGGGGPSVTRLDHAAPTFPAG